MADVPTINTSTWRLPKKAHRAPEATYTDDMYRGKGLPVPPDPTLTTGGSGLPVINTSEWRLPSSKAKEQLNEASPEAANVDPDAVLANLPATEAEIAALSEATFGNPSEKIFRALKEAGFKKPGILADKWGRIRTLKHASSIPYGFTPSGGAWGRLRRALRKEGYQDKRIKSIVSELVALGAKAEGVEEGCPSHKANGKSKKSFLKRKKQDVGPPRAADDDAANEAQPPYRPQPPERPALQRAGIDIPRLRRLAGLEESTEIEFATGTPHRQMPDTQIPEAMQSPRDKAYNMILGAGAVANITREKREIEALAKQLGTTLKKLAYETFDRRLQALKRGARPVTGVQDDLKKEMAYVARAAKKLGMYDELVKAAKKHDAARGKKESAPTTQQDLAEAVFVDPYVQVKPPRLPKRKVKGDKVKVGDKVDDGHLSTGIVTKVHPDGKVTFKVTYSTYYRHGQSLTRDVVRHHDVHSSNTWAESAVPADQQKLAGLTESSALPLPMTDTRGPQTPGRGLLDNGPDDGESYVDQVLRESRWFFKEFEALGGTPPFAEAPGGRAGPWRGSEDEPAETPIVRKGKVKGAVGEPEEEPEGEEGEEEPKAKGKKPPPPKRKAKKPEEGEGEGEEEEGQEEWVEMDGLTEGERLRKLAGHAKALGHRLTHGKAATRARAGLRHHFEKFKKRHGIDVDKHLHPHDKPPKKKTVTKRRKGQAPAHKPGAFRKPVRSKQAFRGKKTPHEQAMARAKARPKKKLKRIKRRLREIIDQGLPNILL